MATLESVEGLVEARKAGQAEWFQATLNDTYSLGDSIRVLSNSRASISLPDDTYLRLDQNTRITLIESADENRTWLDLLIGIIHVISREPRAIKIDTPFASAGLEGTEFIIGVTEDETSVTVLEGEVSVTTDSGAANVASGQRAIARTGQQPLVQVVARPQDAVQWTLYYAPILDYELPAADREADLGQVNDPRFYAGRAARRLSVGRVREAQDDLTRALSLDSTNVDALALQSIIALALDDKIAALELANRAVALDSQAAAGLIARSYAQQSQFDLSGALASLLAAVDRDPENALAWARLSELWLSLGDLDQSLYAARKSVSLNPILARTQTVLGFAYLSRFEIELAQKSFEKAITFDQAAPLPRLGLGLALIRQGALVAGRSEIEIAVILDPGNALVRSYMGKAYYEEKRDDLSASQLDMSKQLDPLDPTPWFYNAIRMQTINRPVEALQDLRQSIELNDNRAVYRSRLALDEDLAVRGASITRIYENLGFNKLAQIEASRSLRLDPSNHSAHRFLSDAYSRLTRHEIARISELLQSQLLQPVNINPVQPGLPFIGLNPVSRIGPAESRASEYSSLFERDQFQVTASGAFGNMNSLSGEVIASGLWDDLSFSAGVNHQETDGFRDNYDQKNDIYNLFAQWAVTPRLNLQAEIRHRKTEQGDLNFNFDPEDFYSNDRRNFDEDILRLGARIDAAPRSTFLLSVIHGDLDEQLVLVDEEPGKIFTLVDQTEDKGNQLELQNILVGEGYNVITGLGFQRVDATFDSVDLENGVVNSEEKGGFEREYQNIYLYGGFDYSPALKLTFGAGYLDFTENQKDVDELEPKLGVEWEIVENVRLRGTYFKSAKRPLIVSQTIEPTQVAGFNQLYDDSNGSVSERAGVGIDTSLTQNILIGFEISRREIDFLIGTAVEKRQEDLFQAYQNWMISESWAFKLDMAYEDYTNEKPLESSRNTPLKFESLTIPASIRYFAPSGLFAGFQTTYLMQDLERGENASLSEGEEDVVLLDLAIGYRFPKRRGTISLNVLNALDESFFYQDDGFRSTDVTRSSGFIPERRAVLLISYVF